MSPGHISKQLGKCAYRAAKRVRQLGWVRFIKQLQHPIDLAPNLHLLNHPAGPLLQRLSRSGVPAPSSGPPWTLQQKDAVFARGPHVSANRLFRDFLQADMLDYVKKGFWVVLPYSAVRHLPHLKLAPSGVVPQRERRPRPIMDYTFTGVNALSLPLAPHHSMQIGNTLPRLLQRLSYANPSFGPPLLLKFDLSDGYYRVHLAPEAALELAVVLPGPHRKPLIGIPLSLPMGWALSPPYFCAFTETAADVANASILDTPTYVHPLETSSQHPDIPVPQDTVFLPTYVRPPGPCLPAPLNYVDVYIDDFIAIAQYPALRHTLHHTLTSILKIFRDAPHPDDNALRRHIISDTKLQKGDAAWSSQKIILGWLLDTSAGTLRLPPHKADRLRNILLNFYQKQRTSRRQWQRLLGELRHMGMAIRGARFLFSVLQNVLTDSSSRRLRLTPLVKAALLDWLHLSETLASLPVPITALVPKAPSYAGAVDASGDGCGGFWLATQYGALPQPIAFRWKFPTHIATELITATNPTGTVSNSDFELAALVLALR